MHDTKEKSLSEGGTVGSILPPLFTHRHSILRMLRSLTSRYTSRCVLTRVVGQFEFS